MSYLDCRSSTFRELAAGRYFTTFDNVAQSYVQIASQVVVSSGDIIEIDFASEIGQSAFATLFDGNVTNRIAARNDNGTWFFAGLSNVTVNGIPISSGDAFPTDSKLNNLNATINVDGAIEFVGGNFVQTSTAFYSGILANLKITSNSSNVLNMPINRYYTPQNNVVLDESGNGNNGTFVNVAQGDSVLYRTRSDGNFRSPDGDILEVAY